MFERFNKQDDTPRHDDLALRDRVELPRRKHLAGRQKSMFTILETLYRRAVEAS